MPTKIKTPAGRIVWGHPTTSVLKFDDHKQPVLDKLGKQVEEFMFGLAIPRAEFEAVVWPAMYAEALTGFPTGQFPADMSFKYKDGDTAVKQNGVPYSASPHNVGNIIISVKTQMCPSIFKHNGAGWDQMEGSQIKCGDWVAVTLNLKVNVSTNPRFKSSLYVNPEAIEFVAYDTAIASSVDPVQALGAATAVPVGLSNVPTAAPVGAVGIPAPVAPVAAAPVAHALPPVHAAPVPNAYAPPVAPVAAAPAALPPPAQGFTAPAAPVAAAPVYAPPAAPVAAAPQPAPVAPQPAPVAPQPGAVPGMLPPR